MHLRRDVLMLLFFLTPVVALAQAPGSTTVYGGPLQTVSLSAGSTLADAAETLYIGPGTYVIDGTWEIYSKNVVIDPAAVITGSGTIHFFNPSAAGGAASQTLVDGNTAAPIDVNLVLDNPDGLQLKEIPVSPDLTAAGFSDNPAASTLQVGKDLLLATDGANVFLGTGTAGDLAFDADATISGYGVNRMVVTNNSTLSHMTKENLASAFVFPVGIAAGDYTPATVAPASATTIHVSVQDYSASPPVIPAPAKGMARTWQVFGDASVPATLTLQHNVATNGSSYTDASAFVTQYNGSGWSSPGTVDYVSPGIHTHTGYSLPSSADNTAFFSKTSDAVTPLPVTLVAFSATPEGPSVKLAWRTSQESNSDYYAVQHSLDARTWHTLGTIPAAGESQGFRQYGFTDGAPANGVNYYRLLMVDKDRTAKYSDVRSVEIQVVSGLKVYPNPVVDRLSVTSPNWSDVRSVRVVSLQGQVVYEDGPVTEIGVRHLAPGVYVLQLARSGGGVEQKKFVIVR
ncbi:Por secretion system C-terminal sorting domain-containing protein [Siphonobacter aquaeclarae]|uniref:Por secretion system C-terminal sorting domain-containing protein n=2 Tax=Siphonobacter aquaeclarae TaxID=563176 RepID=A0A1G9KTZ0_9BACT|nr:Por secretion system C-terminal sorting domain-containing protein [Siphonobacter aquaeclarae]